MPAWSLFTWSTGYFKPSWVSTTNPGFMIVTEVAAIQAQAKPRSINKPHAAESAPKVPPDIRAVFAPEGFDKNPASPQRIKKTPNATNQRPLVFIIWVAD